MFSGPLHNPANHAPGIQIGHAPGVIYSHRLIMEKKLKRSSFLKPLGPQLVYLVCYNV